MNFSNTEMKIDAIVNYLNENKINLSPAFQRGHVWNKKLRSSLLKNILSRKPIPAIFLYKKESGSKYSYNILDGKQRIESLILFISNQRSDLSIKNWHNYFSSIAHRKNVNFDVELEGKKYTFKNLPDNYIRNFREYQIPTVEITLDNETSLDEIISLFVDINQQGIAVSRFHIVKAMCSESKVMQDSFDLIALKQKKGKTHSYKIKDTPISKVLKNLTVIQRTSDIKVKVDKIWEKLIELILFYKSQKQRKPADILKGFISRKDEVFDIAVSKNDIKIIRDFFKFYWSLYKSAPFKNSKLSTDQAHLYTSLTTLLKYDLLRKYGEKKLALKVINMSKLIENGKSSNASINKNLKEYLGLCESHTTDASKRDDREKLFKDILANI